MELSELSDVDFAQVDSEELISGMKKLVETYLERELAEADPLTLFIRAIGGVIIQQRLLIDEVAKQNLLAYATGNNLEHLGILVGCARIGATSATVTMKLTLSAVLNTSLVIPAKTRYTAGDGVYFINEEDIIIEAGNETVEFKASCTTSGHVGNNYAIGVINQIVDVKPYMKSVENITESAGGADIETDEEYRERIRAAPEQFSNAGSRGAYEYHTKQVSSLISDVCVSSPSAGVVKIQPLLSGGNLPTTEILDAVAERLNDRTIRPLTDQVIVESPEIISYDIDVKYYINRSKATYAASIQEKVTAAVENYISWQREKLGRDVEPLELGYLLRSAGVKRIEMNSPTFIATQDNQVAIPNNINILFGGLEND